MESNDFTVDFNTLVLVIFVIVIKMCIRDMRRAVRPLRAQMRAMLRRHPEYVTPAGF